MKWLNYFRLSRECSISRICLIVSLGWAWFNIKIRRLLILWPLKLWRKWNKSKGKDNHPLFTKIKWSIWWKLLMRTHFRRETLIWLIKFVIRFWLMEKVPCLVFLWTLWSDFSELISTFSPNRQNSPRKKATLINTYCQNGREIQIWPSLFFTVSKTTWLLSFRTWRSKS